MRRQSRRESGALSGLQVVRRYYVFAGFALKPICLRAGGGGDMS